MTMILIRMLLTSNNINESMMQVDIVVVVVVHLFAIKCVLQKLYIIPVGEHK